jgi:hypothetical protein
MIPVTKIISTINTKTRIIETPKNTTDEQRKPAPTVGHRKTTNKNSV